MRLRFPLTGILLLWLAVTASAADNGTPPDWDAAERQLKSWQSEANEWAEDLPSETVLVKRQREAIELRARADACISDNETQAQSIRERLTALGEEDPKDAPDLRKLRTQLNKEQRQTDLRLAVCRLLGLGARDLRDVLQQMRRDMFSRMLLRHDSPVWRSSARLLDPTLELSSREHLRIEPWPAIGLGLMLTLLLLPVAVLIGQALRRQFESSPEPSIPTAPVLLARMYGRRLPWATLVGIVMVVVYLGGAPPIASLLSAVLASLLLAPLLELLVCHSSPHCNEGGPARVMMALVVIAAAFMAIQGQHYMPAEVYVVLRAIYVFLLAINAMWLLLRLSRREHWETLRSLRVPIAVLILAGPSAEWLGYRNLGEFLVLGIYGTLVGSWIVWLSYHMLSGALNLLDENAAQPEVREWLGYQPGEHMPGVGLLRLLLIGTLLVALGYWLIFAWQVSPADTAAMREVIDNGFQIGAVTIVPARLVGAVLAFVLLLTLARWLRQQLGERWLTHTRLDKGARESIVSLTTYTIIGVAIMLALSMAGLEFQNLAIIAGALSVGIGFGLQNIVNNFVSGLILLFERPVRPGDWIVVGNTEGYVKRISIRYTQIQTFDRADVLVPNSELISNQVTNWMLTDSIGRVIVPIGVAYGTDTRKVRDILNRIAREHPLVLTSDPRVNAPKVMFMGFGDSSLNFELRCFIRDIDYKLSVRSDLLFAIDDAFRADGIEIPFPQSVVHVAHDHAPDHLQEKPPEQGAGE